MSPAALTFDQVSRAFVTAGGGEIVALHPTSFTIPRGRAVAVVGRSGSGKSTLLHLSAGIDQPSTGTVRVHGQALTELTERERTRVRRDDIGLVFQFFHLLPHLSVRDNVALPELIAGRRRRAFAPRVQTLLERVGLGDRADEDVERLSGGERQRVAICRALIREPALVLADEPTGNLDDETGREVMDLMLSLTRREGRTLVFVTHSPEMAARADEIWTLHSGHLDIP